MFEYAYGPRAQSSIGGEWGWYAVRRRGRSFRFGMYAMMALENHDARRFFPPSELWRGMAGLSGAWSLEGLADRWLPEGSALEASVVFGHESDHGHIDRMEEPDDISMGGGGDFLYPDCALRIPVWGEFLLTARIGCRLYLYGALLTAPGAECILRWRRFKRVVPAIALFGEGLFPRDEPAREGFFIRVMPCLIVGGVIGEATFFGSLDGGNGKGLLVNNRAARVSAGVRYAPFAQ